MNWPTRRLKSVAGPHYETACDLARGYPCGNCKTGNEFHCIDDGCVELREGIYEALQKAERDGQTKAMREMNLGAKRG